MSGFVGIINLDGTPVEPRLLDRLTDFLTFRGPDARRTWLDGPVGFGHTLLKTTFESERERQPATLDGQVWIIADARIDARAELMEELRQRGDSSLANARSALECGSSSYRLSCDSNQTEKAVAAATSLQGACGAVESLSDVELILHAYHAWGEDCVEHLIGDFAFAMWDTVRKRLICSRDHMGVKPFYYAQVGHCVVFSNTLECLRRHPAVSDKLNDAAIADFLLAGSNENPATTTFADIQRLPPAHTAIWTSEGLRLRRYWTLPIDEPLIYPHPEDYAARFRELLRMAVSDRLRTNRVGIYMSGGLDSSGLAATACEIARERSGSPSVKAFTAVYDHAIPDRERYYAGLVAKHLGIPIHFWACDEEMLTPWSENDLAETPEPICDPHNQAAGLRHQREMAAFSRVIFYGEGPDNALGCEWLTHLALLRKKGRYGRMLPGFLWHVFGHPRIPFVGRLRNWLEGYRKRTFPTWLNPDFASRLRLGERWEELQSGPPLTHPTRPKGYQAMDILLWQDLFEGFDISGSRTLSEVRHPYLDIRFIRFLLSVPAIPWCCNKYLCRRALGGVLPKEIVRRPKTPMARDPNYERARRFGMPKFPVVSPFLCYVNPNGIAQMVGKNIEDFRVAMRAIGLAFWLHDLEVQKTGAIVEEPPYEAAGERISCKQ